MKKIRVGIFFGGRSSEHEISVVSAKNIIKNLDKDRYEITVVGVGKDGAFHFGEAAVSKNMPSAFEMMEDLRGIDCFKNPADSLQRIDENLSKIVDVIFPVFHGPFGEDGTVQGMLELFGVPFVGAGVLGSAISMDKDVSKRLLRDANIKSAKYLVFHDNEFNDIRYDFVAKTLGDVIFVKPANLGSSIGVSKVKSKGDFKKAIKHAFSYDNKVIVEEFINGREIECSVLGNENPEASALGEIVVKHEFYSYEAKYCESSTTGLQFPANLSSKISDEIKAIAIKAFKVLCCEGMARVDFFVKDNFEIFLNEVNTIPGFTEISMYPKLWQISGIEYSELLNKLIDLAISRNERSKRAINTTLQ